MSSPSTYDMDLNSQIREHDHNLNDYDDHNDYGDHNDYDDHNITDELPTDDFDGGEYEHSNGGDRSPSNTGSESFDQAVVPSINRTYHPIINGGFFVLLSIFHIYSQIHFQGRSVMNTAITFHQTLIHHLHPDLTSDHMTGPRIKTGLNLNWPTFSTVVIRCPPATWTLFSSCGPPLSRSIKIHLLSQIILKCIMPSTQPSSAIFLGNFSHCNTTVIYLKAKLHRG